MSVETANQENDERAERIAASLAEAIKNGGCPNCGTSIGVIHTEADRSTYRQCGYCGLRYDKKEAKKEEETQVNG